MFENASAFNGNISTWNTGNVKDMSWMFNGAHSFNGDLSKWDTWNVEKGDNNLGYMMSFTNKLPVGLKVINPERQQSPWIKESWREPWFALMLTWAFLVIWLGSSLMIILSNQRTILTYVKEC